MSLSIAVIGATGDVGRGITRAAGERGWNVTAVGRDLARLEPLAPSLGSPALVEGSIATAADAERLADALDIGGLDAVVVATSAGWEPRAALETQWSDAAGFFDAYLQTHMAAGTTFVPRLAEGAVLLGIGGGMADFPAPGMGAVSMAQAAQRMWYRHLAREAGKRGVQVREVIVASMVAGDSNRDQADSAWLSDAQIGASVCDVLADPAAHKTITTLAPEA